MEQTYKVKTRLLTSMVSAGQIGKTTVLGEGIVPWLKFADVEHSLIDADTEHRTLSERHDLATQLTVATAEDFANVIKRLGVDPVEIIDFPAQRTSDYVGWMTQRNYLELLDAKAVRITLFIFAASEMPAAMQSADLQIEAFGDRVDYVIVENPARFKSDGFYTNSVGKRLMALGAKKISVPFVMAMTRDAVKRASVDAGRWLTFDDAKMHVGDVERLDIEYFINQMAVRSEDIAEVLVPDPASIKNKCVRGGFPVKEREKSRPRFI